MSGGANIYWQCVGGALPSWAPVASTSPLPVSGANFSYSHLTANGTTIIKSGSGSLHLVAVGTAGSAGTLTLYDSTSGSGSVIAVVDLTARGSVSYDIAFTNGLTAVIASAAGSPDVTISWQ